MYLLRFTGEELSKEDVVSLINMSVGSLLHELPVKGH